MKGKTIFLLAGLIAISVLLTTANAGPKYTMKFANVVSQDVSWGRGAEKFKEIMAQESNGQIEVAVHHSGALGKNLDVLNYVKMGTVDFMLPGVGNATGVVPELGVIILPYLWKDGPTMYKALDGEFGEVLEKKLADKGYVLLGWWDNGFRNVSNNLRPINALADFKGMRIRTLPTKVHVAFFSALGASPTPIDWTELYLALQQGLVDAQENPPAMTYFGKLYEVQKYYSLTEHVNEPGVFLMSKKVMDKLPPDLQAAVRSAAKKATLWQREENEKDNQMYLAKLKEAGVQVNTVSPQAIEEIRKVAQTVYPVAEKDCGDDAKTLIQKMIDFNK
jgi:TRAP-type transport system periplasmic protein